jgi:hypothetical protein
MAKKVREQAIALSSYLKSVNSEDISENQDVQRMFCWDNPAINELIVTVLTEDYIPPIILGEEELGGDLTQQYIVDGIQRTTALNKFRHMNWKTTKSFENSVIQYQAKMRDDEGHLIKDKDGSILWENREFDIKNKTFEQLPDELKKKFDDYQIRIVIHQNCTMQEISKLVRRYNRNKSMGSNQKALTWIPTYARKIKNIANNEFYKNCVSYSKSMRKNGTYEQTVANSVMATFHLNDWKKTPNDRNEYLEENSSFDEFEKVNEYGNRIAKVCGNKFQNIFVFKDILCWIATFDKFTKLGVKDNKFAEFVNALVNDLHDKVIGEWSYDLLDKEAGTSDKKIIQAKIDIYTALMMDYLHIDTETLTINPEETTLSFVQENANPDATEEDIEFYRDMVEDCVRVDEPVYQQCERAVIAIMAYACMKEQDEEFEKWIQRYKNQINFSPSQKTNFTYMKNSFDKYVQKGASGK